MKKFFVLCVCVLISVSLFASAGHIGGSIMGNDTDIKIKTGTDRKFTGKGLEFMLNGANYFGDAARFGIGYSIGFGSTDSPELDGVNLKKVMGSSTGDSALEASLSVLFMYRQPINNVVSLEIGAGIAAGGSSMDYSYTELSNSYTDRETIAYAGPCGEMNVIFNLADHFALTTGIRCTTVTKSSCKYEKKRITVTDKTYDASGSYIACYAGAAYTF